MFCADVHFLAAVMATATRDSTYGTTGTTGTSVTGTSVTGTTGPTSSDTRTTTGPRGETYVTTTVTEAVAVSSLSQQESIETVGQWIAELFGVRAASAACSRSYL